MNISFLAIFPRFVARASRLARILAVLFVTLLFFGAMLHISPSGAAAESGGEHQSDKPAKSKKKKKKSKKKSEKKDEHANDEAAVEEVKEAKPIGAEEGVSNQEFDKALLAPQQLDAVLLLDSSRSMTRTDPHRLRDQGAKLFVRFLSANDRLAIMQFDENLQTIFDLQTINPSDLTGVDQAIESIPNQGNFTDLEQPITAAINLLLEKGNPDAIRTVVLLSDGKMDPHPQRGSAEQLLNELKSKTLPLYKAQHVKLYTLSLSDEADKTLLAELAHNTDGLHWFASDANTVHLRFSDLFLELKKPQVVSIEKGGFEIDNGVQEATFYISHDDGLRDIALVDARGQEITNQHLISGMKWFKGEMFDVITINQPLPGRWLIKGIDEPEGYATLLTDLKLQVKWPSQHVKVGDSILAFARLSDKDKLFAPGKAEEILFFNHKIVSSASKVPIASGTFADDGLNGDEHANDGIYTALIHIDEPGDYTALISVTSPTFTRQQVIPFAVGGGGVVLELKEPDEFGHKERSFRVALGSEMLGRQKLDVKLLVKDTETKKLLSVRMKKVEGSDDVYEVAASALPPGHYQASARITWQEGKTEQSEQSSAIDYESVGHEPQLIEEVNPDVPAEPEEESYILLYSVFIVLSLGWSGGLAYFVLTRFKSGKDRVKSVQAYSIPEELEAKLNVIKAKASAERRTPNEEDVKMRELLLVEGAVTASATVTDDESVATEHDGTSPTEHETEEVVPSGGGDEEGDSRASASEETPPEVSSEDVEDNESGDGNESTPSDDTQS